MDETYMIGIGIFMILILTLVYEPPIREGLDIGKEMRKAFEKPIKDVKKSTEKEFNKAKKETSKGFNVVKKSTEKAAKETKKETTKGFNVVKKGAEKAAKEASKAFDDIFAEIQNIINYIVCAFDKIKSLPDCFFWYFLDMVYGIFYLFYSMLAFAVPPLKDVGKMTWKGVKGADELIYDLMGFHIIGYPKDVMNKCYLCKPQRKKKRR